MAIATAADIAAVVGRDLTLAEQAAVERRVQAAVGVLEGVLHRTLELDAYVETYDPIPGGSVPSSAASGWSTLGYGHGLVYLARRPVAAITTVTATETGIDLTPRIKRRGDVLVVPTLEQVEVDYLAGDDPVAPQVADVITNVVARSVMVPAEVAAGIDLNYTVEGTTIGYGNNNTSPSGTITYGSFTPDEMAGLRASLGRLVVR